MREIKERKSFADLRPLSTSGRKKLGKFVVFDIEANNWKDFVIGGIYDGHQFTTHKSIDSLYDSLNARKDTVIFAHFGGIYDFLFILDHHARTGGALPDLLPRGSSFLGFDLGTNKFIDSSGIFPFALEKVARAFKVKHLKQEIDHKKTKRANDPELIKYLEHDCKALYESIEKFFSSDQVKNLNFKPTIASLSLEKIRTTIKKPIPDLKGESMQDYVRQAYAGGRTEIFKGHYNNPKKPLYYYDFNSLYPWAMFEMDVPGRPIKSHKRIVPLAFIDVEVEAPKDIKIPVLWKKVKGTFFFPKGRFRGVFPGIELIESLNQGYTIHKIHNSVEFSNEGKIFQEFVKENYELKQYATDPVAREISKMFLNHSYGRIGIKRDREILTLDHGQSGIKPSEIVVAGQRYAFQPNFFNGFSNPAIGAMITAQSRLKLFRTMKPIEDEVYYCDTDSIITTAKLQTGPGLGELKLEDTTHRAVFLLPKSYHFNKTKLKGFPKEFAEKLNYQEMAEALHGDIKISTKNPNFYFEPREKLAKIRSTKKSGTFLKLIKESHREIKKRYDKRKFNLDFSTTPIDIKEITK